MGRLCSGVGAPHAWTHTSMHTNMLNMLNSILDGYPCGFGLLKFLNMNVCVHMCMHVVSNSYILMGVPDH